MWEFSLFFRLKQLSQVRKLQDVVQYNLFPSADMILSLSRECGTERWEPNVRVDIKVDSACHPVGIKRHKLLDTNNEAYMKHLKSKPCKDFIQVTKKNLFPTVWLAGFTVYTNSILSRTTLGRWKKRASGYRSPKPPCSVWAWVDQSRSSCTAPTPSNLQSKSRRYCAIISPRCVGCCWVAENPTAR